jgi:CHASE1-domain containing sensor protein
MFFAQRRRFGDLETMFNKISFRVSEVCPVEPDVALITEAVDSEPAATPLTQSVEVKAVPIQDPVGVTKLFNIAPQAWNFDLNPATVIEVDVTHTMAFTFFGLASLPATRQGDSPFSIL